MINRLIFAINDYTVMITPERRALAKNYQHNQLNKNFQNLNSIQMC